MRSSIKCFSRVTKMPIVTHNRENSVVINKALILIIIHNRLTLRDAVVDICIILVLLKTKDGLSLQLNI
jgi:hypothetical protein